MITYILGKFKNFFNPAVKLFAIIDQKSKINRKAKIINSKIDKYSIVGVKTIVCYADVGKFCSIAGSSVIGLGSHPTDIISTSPIFYSKHNGTGYSWVKSDTYSEFKKVIIGNDVWIGARVLIMGGVKIGDGAIIAAGSIVTKDVPPYAIVGGVPAKIIRYRFDEEIISLLKEIEWWIKDESFLKDNIELFQNKINKESLMDLKD